MQQKKISQTYTLKTLIHTHPHMHTSTHGFKSLNMVVAGDLADTDSTLPPVFKALFTLPCKEVRRPKAFWFLIIGDKEAKVPCILT